MEFGILVGGDVDALAVFAEAATLVGNFRSAAFGSEQSFFSAGGIEDPEIRLIG